MCRSRWVTLPSIIEPKSVSPRDPMTMSSAPASRASCRERSSDLSRRFAPRNPTECWPTGLPSPYDLRPRGGDLSFLSFAMGLPTDKSLLAWRIWDPSPNHRASSIDESLRGYRLMAPLVRLWVDVSHQL